MVARTPFKYRGHRTIHNPPFPTTGVMSVGREKVYSRGRNSHPSSFVERYDIIDSRGTKQN